MRPKIKCNVLDFMAARVSDAQLAARLSDSPWERMQREATEPAAFRRPTRRIPRVEMEVQAAALDVAARRAG